jgi:predicted GH43/DUF377 family glycosyl hydrolase/ferredoxin-NADP reductase
MITVRKEGVIIRNTDLPFENDAVLNPAVIRQGESVYFFYRAVKEGNYSSIGFCKLRGPLNVIERSITPILFPEFDYESHGMEDPRIVKIEDTFYLTYIAFDGHTALGALATSNDLRHFKKQGIIVPKIKINDFKSIVQPKRKVTDKYFSMNIGNGYLMDKDVVFFPRKINNKFYFMHRIKPEIQIVAIESLQDLTEEFWRVYFENFHEHIMLSPRFSQELSFIGSGCPPIETKEGWLIIYHGVNGYEGGYSYSVRIALMDINDPQREIARLPYQLFKPHLDYELSGVVDKVCFPTGATVFGDTLYIYYGAADKCIACASLNLSSLLEELLLKQNLKKNIQQHIGKSKTKHIVKVKTIGKVTHNVLRIVTEKPPNFSYSPGQATEVSINKNEWINELRPFSFTSLPENNYLEFTIKIYPQYHGVTNELSTLVPGDELIVHDVFGTISYQGEGIFIAGGAGVTPFISILRSLDAKNEIGQNRLIFASKTKKDIILEPEFQTLLKDNFISILSQDNTTDYANGHITKEFLKVNVPDFSKKFYLCGPEAMMDEVEKQLYDLGVSDRSIIKEEL